MPIRVRPAAVSDRPRLAEMRAQLWPKEDPDGLAAELPELLGAPDFGIFVAERDKDLLVGFAEVGERSYAEGASAGPVAYVEGIWVAPDARRSGVGKALLREAEKWARRRGHGWLGSDALIANRLSHQWHGAMGFREVERLVVFGKPIG